MNKSESEKIEDNKSINKKEEKNSKILLDKEIIPTKQLYSCKMITKSKTENLDLDSLLLDEDN